MLPDCRPWNHEFDNFVKCVIPKKASFIPGRNFETGSFHKWMTKQWYGGNLVTAIEVHICSFEIRLETEEEMTACVQICSNALQNLLRIRNITFSI